MDAESPEQIITTEGKIGYEYLLTKQISHIMAAHARMATDPDAYRTFKNEVAMLARLMQPYIVEKDFRKYANEKSMDYVSGVVTARRSVTSLTVKYSESLFEYCMMRLSELGFLPKEKGRAHE